MQIDEQVGLVTNTLQRRAHLFHTGHGANDASNGQSYWFQNICCIDEVGAGLAAEIDGLLLRFCAMAVLASRTTIGRCALVPR